MNGMTIRCPNDCYSVLRRYSRMKQEHFGIILLNSQREIIQTKCLFVGSDNICHVHKKMIFWLACKKSASAIVLFHNHPSGNPDPSDYDINLTNEIVKGGELLGIQILDHLIVSKNGYYSFVDHEMINQTEKKLRVAE